MTLLEHWSAAAHWYDERSSAQRSVLIALAVALVVAAFDLVWFQDLRSRIDAQHRDARALHEEHDLLADQLAGLEALEAEDPNRAVRGSIDAETERLAILDRQLRERALEILAPEQMKRVLRDLLGGIRSLELTSLETERAAALIVGASEGSPNLFRHGVALHLEGDFLGLLQAVQQLEALPWRFYWSALEIHADRNTTRRIQLRVYTVSLREEWLRV